MGTKGRKCLNKPICLSMYGRLYLSGIKGVLCTKSILRLINMSISTHAQLISVLVYIHHYYKQCHSTQRSFHVPDECLSHFICTDKEAFVKTFPINISSS